MSIITFGEEDAKTLAWVAAGAESSDPSSLLIIDIDSNNDTAKITTNTGAFIRSMSISVDDAKDESIALRAKTLSSAASKVEEGLNLTLTTDGDRVNVACGATSLSLTNLYPHAMDITRRMDKSKVATLPAGQFIYSLTNAGAASPKGDVTIAFDNDGLVTVGVRNDRIHTQELYPATLHENDVEPARILGSLIKPLKPLLKLESIVDLEMFIGTGFMFLKLPITAADVYTTDITYTIPLVVSGAPVESSPCDEDIETIFTIDRSLLRSALVPLSGALSPFSSVVLKTTASGQVVISVESDEGTGKTTIIDADIMEEKEINVLLGDVYTALKTISEKVVNIGAVVDDDGSTWMMVTPVDEDADDEDEDYNDGDIVIAIACELSDIDLEGDSEEDIQEEVDSEEVEEDEE